MTFNYWKIIVIYLISSVVFYYINPSLVTWLIPSIVLVGVGFCMSYAAKRITDYMVKIYGSEVEANPNVKKMYEIGDFTMRNVALLVMLFTFLATTILAVLNIASGAIALSVAASFCVLTTEDFIHDYKVYQNERREK